MLKTQIKRSLKRAAHGLGFEIRRLKRSEIVPGAHEPSPTTGLIVEMVGPSGAGKSTLINHMTPNLRRRWFFQRDIKPHAFNGFELPLAQQGVYEALLWRRIEEVIREEAHLSERSARLSFCSRLIQEDMALTACRYPKGFFIDDGICHNYAASILQLLQEGEHGMAELLNKRAFVFCLPKSIDFIVANIKERRTKSPPLRGNNYPGRSTAELFALCEKSDQDRRRLLEAVQALNCPVLVLSAEAAVEVKAQEIFAFERELLQRNARPRKGSGKAARQDSGDPNFAPARRASGS